MSVPWIQALRQACAAGDVYIVGAEDSVLKQLFDIAEAASACVVVTEDDDGTKWVSASPAGIPALEKSLRWT